MDEKLRSFWQKLNSDAKDLWAKDKIFFILFGILIIIVKFRDVLISMLVASGKRVMDDAKKKDEQLASQENQAKTESERLVEQAKQEPSKETPVDDNWYKKQ